MSENTILIEELRNIQANISDFSSLNESFYQYISGKVLSTITNSKALSVAFLQKVNYYTILVESEAFKSKEKLLTHSIVSFWNYFSQQSYCDLVIKRSVADVVFLNKWANKSFNIKDDFISQAKNINHYYSLEKIIALSKKSSRFMLVYPHTNDAREKFLYGFSIQEYTNYWVALRALIEISLKDKDVIGEVVTQANFLLDSLQDFSTYLTKVLKVIPKELGIDNYALLMQVSSVINLESSLSKNLFLNSSFLEGVLLTPIAIANPQENHKDAKDYALALGDLHAAVNIILRDLILSVEKPEIKNKVELANQREISVEQTHADWEEINEDVYIDAITKKLYVRYYNDRDFVYLGLPQRMIWFLISLRKKKEIEPERIGHYTSKTVINRVGEINNFCGGKLIYKDKVTKLWRLDTGLIPRKVP